MPEGKVKWFDNKKGYGFILRDDGSDLFVHFSAIKAEGYKTLREGDLVKYEVTKGDKGDQAAEVEVLEKAKRQRKAKEEEDQPEESE
jgi:CspA family cold shock protein